MYAGSIQLKPTQSQLVRSNREMGRTNWELNHTYSSHVHQQGAQQGARRVPGRWYQGHQGVGSCTTWQGLPAPS